MDWHAHVSQVALGCIILPNFTKLKHFEKDGCDISVHFLPSFYRLLLFQIILNPYKFTCLEQMVWHSFGSFGLHQFHRVD